MTSDPGKALAWLVLLSTAVTFLLGHLVYLALFGLLYVTWLYGDNLSIKSRDRMSSSHTSQPLSVSSPFSAGRCPAVSGDSGPIRGQYPGHVISLDQSEASCER